MKKDKIDCVISDIQYYFKFLFDKGYQIQHIKKLPMGDWQVTLSLDNCAIVIYTDRGEMDLVFSPVNSDGNYRVGITGMVYFLSYGQNYIGKFKRNFFDTQKKQFERLATLLNEYIDQITPYFGEDFEKYKQELILVQQKCLAIYMDKYISKRKHGDWG